MIGETELKKAQETLGKYKEGKKVLEGRVVEEERWYRLRHWEVIRDRQSQDRPEPTSAWLFNAIMNKHADAMDNYPEANILPREPSDQADAKTLSAILPVILERCGFEDTYSENWWEKLKHGTAVYGCFWNSALENGLGDVDIKRVDLLNIFWEPGVSDIQDSRELFLVTLVDNDLLEGEYPQLKGRVGGDTSTLKQYIHDDTIDLSGKSAVVDWYYKLRDQGGKTLVHYAKYVGDTLLFASENEPEYAQRGFYDHGQYPFVFDTLFPEKGTPCGFGYVALCKDPQMYIDKLYQLLLENAMMSGRKRWFVGASTGVNEKEFLDWNKPIVHVEGSGNLDETHLREITVSPVGGALMNLMEQKINELKETASNRDVSNGGSASGVTAAAAIAALQEAGNKTSRDMIAGSYRAYTKLDYIVIELIRQFYDQARSFRITGEGPEGYSFVTYENSGLADQDIGRDSAGNPLVRRPVFDIKIKAQKKNPFSRMSQNELAKELYGLGVFNPERAQETLGMLEMMDFEGKDRLLEEVRQGATLLNQLQQLAAQNQQLMAALGAGSAQGPQGQEPGGFGTRPYVGQRGQDQGQSQGAGMDPVAMGAEAMTPYMERLAKRSSPDMDTGGAGVGM